MPQIKRLSPTVSGYLFVIQNTLLAVSDPAVTNVVRPLKNARSL